MKQSKTLVIANRISIQLLVDISIPIAVCLYKPIDNDWYIFLICLQVILSHNFNISIIYLTSGSRYDKLNIMEDSLHAFASISVFILFPALFVMVSICVH